MPVIGDWMVPPSRTGSVYDKKGEKSSPGYYAVTLDDFKTKVEMTVTTWTGLYHLTSPATKQAHVLVDLGRMGGEMEVVGDRTIHGHAQLTSRLLAQGGGNHGYFVAEFSKPFKNFGTFKQIPPTRTTGREPLIGDKDVETDTRTISGNYAGAYVRFRNHPGRAGARQDRIRPQLRTSRAQTAWRKNPGWDFDASTNRRSRLGHHSSIRSKSRAEPKRRRCCSTPACSTRSPARGWSRAKASSSPAPDGKSKTAEYDRYGPVPFWDTGRNQIVLLTLLEPGVKLDILHSQLDMARETRLHGHVVPWRPRGFHVSGRLGAGPELRLGRSLRISAQERHGCERAAGTTWRSI